METRLSGTCGRLVITLAIAWASLPTSAAAQGWIEAPTARGGFAVEKIATEVRVEVVGRVAEVEVTEWFRNEGRALAEGDYLYPLPGEAVFQGFSLFQGDQELRGEIMDAARARQIYEEIVRRRADPALIELAGHGLLRARVFPIAPGEERKVTLRYTQLLSRAGHALQFLYAGGLRSSAEGRPLLRVPGGEQPVDAPRPRALAEPVETSFLLTVENGDAYLDPFSPTHALTVERRAGRLSVESDDELVGSMALFLPLAGDAVGLSVATHRPVGEDGYVMLTLSPGVDGGNALPRDVTAILDVSGSMSGQKIVQAKAALHGLLAGLGPDDRFRLVAFSNALRIQGDGWQSATPRALREARSWVDALVADGGTDIGAALDEAFRLDSDRDRLPVVFFVTDGLPSVGEQSPQRLADRAEDRAGRSRIFAFGVGHDVDTHLLDRLGEAGRGSTDYVQPGENVERAIGLVAAKVRHPVLTDLELDGGRVRLREIYPVRIPDVFAGQELVLFGRYTGSGDQEIRVSGRRGGASESFTATGSFAQRTPANAYIPRLWASRKLGHLMRQLWTEGESSSLVEEIREVALRYGLPSPYTSYLVEEPEMAVTAMGPVPVSPTGQRTFGNAVAPPPQAGRVANSATGKGAVQRAVGAARLRDATTLDEVVATGADMERRAERDDAGVRALAGRLFRLDDGVWVEDGADASKVIRIKGFSAAWFRLRDAMPELAPVLRELPSVRLAGRTVDVLITDEGLEELSDASLRDLIEGFRAADGAP